MPPTLVILSSAFEVEIPQPLRGALCLQPGMAWHVVQRGACIELLPLRSVAAARGLCRGMDPTFERDEADR